MRKRIPRGVSHPVLAMMVLAVTFLAHQRPARSAPVSQLGQYREYSQETYDGNQRTSDYLTLSDGRRLAYDLILPTRDSVPASEPLPVLFKYTPYLRTFTIFDRDGNNIIADLFSLSWVERAFLRMRYWLSDRGHLMDPLFRTRWLDRMVRHGYAVIVVERPGTGASFGLPDMSFEPGAREGDEILDWIAAQPWSDGNIAMFGDSFQAMIQFAIAGSGNPRLKAIFPVSSPLDNYGALIYRGGVYNKAFASFFSWATSFLESVITPVDADEDGALLAQARKERSGETLGETSAFVFKHHPFRDSLLPDGTNLYEDRASLYPFIERINRSGIPVYMTTGWYDLFTGDMFFWYSSLTTPRRLVVLPADHSEIEEDHPGLDFGAEAHRWFDRWLKEIDNGIMEEPPIHYYVLNTSEEEAWQTTSQWPLQMEKPTRFYLGPGETGTVASANDGLLTTEPPMTSDGFDEYTVDYSTTTGTRSRWTAVNWSRDYPDMRSNDEKALTYTSAPLDSDVEITGHPVAHLWLSTDARDLDLFVYLEEVSASGRSTYITEGNLRASHRKLGQAPFSNMRLPYHSHSQSDVALIPAGEAIELVFSLLPTSYRFHRGSRIRIAIVCSDTDNFDTPILDPPPELRLLRGSDHPSFIRLPVAQPG